MRNTTNAVSPGATPDESKQGCCGGKASTETRADASKHDHPERAAPSKAAESSCCGGGTHGGQTEASKAR